MTEGYYFTLPSSEVKRITLTSAVLFGFIVLLIGGAHLNMLAFLVLCHVAGYFLLLKHKYIYVSAEGIRGEGPTGRDVFFTWGDEIELKEHFAYGISGYAIAAPHKKLLLKSIFIPKAILRTQQFRDIVSKWASSNHVLLSQDSR